MRGSGRRTVFVVSRVERARLAGERAQAAGQRAFDLQSRLQALAEGQNSTPWTLDKARDAQARSAADASTARQSAVIAYGRAADAHRAAALMATIAGDSERAQNHRDLALADDARAAALSRP